MSVDRVLLTLAAFLIVVACWLAWEWGRIFFS